MSAHELVDVLWIDEVTNLTACIYPMERLASQGVPETDASIGCSSTTTHGAMLVRWPSNGLHCSNMLIELGLWLHIVGLAPYHQFVIITSRGKLLLIWTPFKPTNFLFVSLKFGEIIFLHSWVSMENALISWSTAQKRVVPGDASNSSVVTVELSDHLLFDNIPILENSSTGTDSQVFSIVWPRDTCDLVLRSKIIKLSDFRSSCRPKVNTRSEAHCKDVSAGPIHQVQIIIILESWCIEHFEGSLLDFPLLCVWLTQNWVSVKTSKRCGLHWDISLTKNTPWPVVFPHNLVALTWTRIFLVVEPTISVVEV